MEKPIYNSWTFIFLYSFILMFAGCAGSKKIVLKSFAEPLTENLIQSFNSDNDPELVEKALPFALKTMESMIKGAPDNKELYASLACGFVSRVFWLSF